MDQRYFLENGIFSMGLVETPSLRSLDSNLRIDYPIPDLSSLDLRIRTMGARGYRPSRTSSPRSPRTMSCWTAPRTRCSRTCRSSSGKGTRTSSTPARAIRSTCQYLHKRAEANGLRLELGREGGAGPPRARASSPTAASCTSPRPQAARPDPHRPRGVVHLHGERAARPHRDLPPFHDPAAGPLPAVAGQRHQRHAGERGDALPAIWCCGRRTCPRTSRPPGR